MIIQEHSNYGFVEKYLLNAGKEYLAELSVDNDNLVFADDYVEYILQPLEVNESILYLTAINV